jgi:hypothetical protein
MDWLKYIQQCKLNPHFHQLAAYTSSDLEATHYTTEPQKCAGTAMPVIVMARGARHS